MLKPPPVRHRQIQQPGGLLGLNGQLFLPNQHVVPLRTQKLPRPLPNPQLFHQHQRVAPHVRVTPRVKPLHPEVQKPPHPPLQQQVLQRTVVLLQTKKDDVLNPLKQIDRARMLARLHPQPTVRLRLSDPLAKQLSLRLRRVVSPHPQHLPIPFVPLLVPPPLHRVQRGLEKSDGLRRPLRGLLVVPFRPFALYLVPLVIPPQLGLVVRNRVLFAPLPLRQRVAYPLLHLPKRNPPPNLRLNGVVPRPPRHLIFNVPLLMPLFLPPVRTLTRHTRFFPPAKIVSTCQKRKVRRIPLFRRTFCQPEIDK